MSAIHKIAQLWYNLNMANYTDLLGCKFKVHGRNKQEGFDCYGLAIEVLKRNGILLPEVPYDCLDETHFIRDTFFTSVKYEKIDKPIENCIIEIQYKGIPNHLAVYIGSGKLIHSCMDCGVRIEPLHRWENRIKGYYKVSNN